VEQIIVERHAAAGRRTIAGPRLDVASILDVFSLNLAAPHGPPFFPVAPLRDGVRRVPLHARAYAGELLRLAAASG
jgi:hypothetical protein